MRYITPLDFVQLFNDGLKERAQLSGNISVYTGLLTDHQILNFHGTYELVRKTLPDWKTAGFLLTDQRVSKSSQAAMYWFSARGDAQLLPEDRIVIPISLAPEAQLIFDANGIWYGDWPPL